jgi:hypothetical protein
MFVVGRHRMRLGDATEESLRIRGSWKEAAVGVITE